MKPPFKIKRKPIDANEVQVGKHHPETSFAAAERAFHTRGKLKRLVYDLIAEHGDLCDHELEEITGRTHQSVSATRNTLMNSGWVEDSGKRRKTPQGNFAIAWRISAEDN